MASKIQFRRDTAANWASVNPTLSEGELGLEKDTMKYKIGDGVTAWNSLSYYSLSGVFPNITITDEPVDIPSDGIYFFPRNIANRMVPAFVGPSGLDSALQPLLARNKVGYWCPPGNAATVPGVMGYTAQTATGTATARTIAVTNGFTRARRLGYVSAATAGSLGGARVAVAQITLGNGSTGGFFKVIRFGISDAVFVAASRMFVGISSSVAAPTNVEPSTLLNSIGVGTGAADTNLKLFYGGSTAQTPINLGVNFPALSTNADIYELALFSPPTTADKLYYQVSRVLTGQVARGEINNSNPGVTLPANTTLMTYNQSWRSNNATALAVGLDIVSDYIETDN